ncbi:MAG: potassium/proton antiporter [Bacteroidetes bacterium]|nr:potassium/proton antiporter [Bacteroidota bacterium]
MQFSADNIILAGSLLLLAGIVAGKTSARFGVPTLLLFLLIGILAGSEGIGGIHFDDPSVAQLIGIVALNFILFSGGLDTNWKKIKPIVWQGISLSTIGVITTAFAVGIFVHYFFNFTLVEGLLLGAIVSATDAAAVFSILRNRGIRLKPKAGMLLELESGSNDPMAYFLTITLTGVVASGQFDGASFFLLFIKGFFIGGVMGYAMGKMALWTINHIRLSTDGLYPVLLLCVAMFTYSATHLLGGNGFLAVYICAIILGSSDFIHKKSMLKFYDGQAWLMQIILFITLGLLVFPSQVIPVMGSGILMALFLILVARPLGVFTALSLSGMNTRTKLFISWVGLRGSVPIVFATYPLLAGIEKAGMIFNLVFFISVTSVLLQGTTLAKAARWLKIAEKDPVVKPESVAPVAVANEIIEILLPAGARSAGKKIVDLHIPESVQLLSLKRNGEYRQPTGADKLEAGDQLLLIVNNEADKKNVHTILVK